jgi:hypothetical protein
MKNRVNDNKTKRCAEKSISYEAEKNRIKDVPASTDFRDGNMLTKIIEGFDFYRRDSSV